jgi:hypothetical protein
MGVFDWVVWAIAIIILLPLLVTPAGWIVAVALAVVWVLGTYFGRYLLQVERERRRGERGVAKQIRDRGGER